MTIRASVSNVLSIFGSMLWSGIWRNPPRLHLSAGRRAGDRRR